MVQLCFCMIGNGSAKDAGAEALSEKQNIKAEKIDSRGGGLYYRRIRINVSMGKR